MSISEENRLGDVLKYEFDKNYCREVVTIASGQDLKIGTILGVSNGKYTASLTPAAELTEDGISITGGTVSIVGGTSSSVTEDEVTKTTITGGAITVTGGTVEGATTNVLANAILLEDCDATSADKQALVLKRLGIVAEAGIVYPVSATDADKLKYNEELANCGIIVRKSA